MVTESNLSVEVLQIALAEQEKTLDELNRERAALLQDIDRKRAVVSHKISNLKQGIGVLTRMQPTILSFLDELDDLEDGAPDPEREFWEGKHKNSYTRTVTNEILAILLKERPLHRKEITKRVLAKGIILGGKDSVRALSPYLSNDDRFVIAENGKSGMWTLHHEPPAGLCEWANKLAA